MDCKAIQRKIFSFIYGEGNAYELRKIKEHLDRCGDCLSERAIIADILARLKDGMPDDPVPAGFRERVLARIEAAAQEPDSR